MLPAILVDAADAEVDIALEDTGVELEPAVLCGIAIKVA
jgi:hypothetical protein